jgi:predicted metal-dependent hydrolase
LHYPSEYIDYLIHFHGDRDYFECHEVLEEYWKKSSDFNRNSVWVGLIQVAVAFYHYRRNNLKGAFRLLSRSRNLLSKKEKDIKKLGMDFHELLNTLDDSILRLHSGERYKSIILPIIDSELLQQCKAACEKRGFKWNLPSDLQNLSIVNKHLYRDRSDIEKIRLNALRAK